jgi:hypothetical protein
LADGLIIIRNPPPFPRPPAPNPYWRPHPVFAPLEVAFHKVDVSIDGQKATTKVDQDFSIQTILSSRRVPLPHTQRRAHR